jgi:hypothetical protein
MAKYRLAQRFLRIEAIGTQGARHGDPADPIVLQVVVTPADDLTTVTETLIAGPNTRNRLWRQGTGVWIFELDPGKYQAGRQYSCQFRFAMTPQNLNLVRQNFVWSPVPVQAHSPELCVLYGELKAMNGIPEPDGRVVVETYTDYATLNERTGLVDLTPDGFGLWYVELPRGSLARIISGDSIKLVQIPDQASALVSDLPGWQPASLEVDRFGYPRPAAPSPVPAPPVAPAVQQPPLLTTILQQSSDPAVLLALAELKALVQQCPNSAPPITITSFTVVPNVGEKGSTITSLTFSWTYNGTPVNQTISTFGVVTPAALRSKTFNSLAIISDITYTLQATDANANVATANTAVQFQNRRFWGVSANPSPTALDIPLLAGNELSNTRVQTKTLNGGGMYLVFAWPSSFGVPTFIVNSLPSHGWQLTTVLYTNGLGFTESYDIWRSSNVQFGSNIQVSVA